MFKVSLPAFRKLGGSAVLIWKTVLMSQYSDELLLKKLTYEANLLLCSLAWEDLPAEVFEVTKEPEQLQALGGRILHSENHLGDTLPNFEVGHMLVVADREFVVRKVELWDKPGASYLRRVGLAIT